MADITSEHLLSVLNRFLHWRPDLIPYVWGGRGVGAWLPVYCNSVGVFESDSAEPITRARGILLLYPRTREVCHVDGLGQSHLPYGASYMRASGNNSPTLWASALSGSGPLLIEYSKSPVWPDDPSYYETRIKNCAPEPVRVEHFGAFCRRWFQLRLNNVTGDLYSALQFQDWYGVRDDAGWIQPGETVTDMANYGGPKIWWVYWGTHASGHNSFVIGKELR